MIKKQKGTFQKVKFDPKAWSQNIEIQAVVRDLNTHVRNIRRCWMNGHIADMIWNAEMAEIKMSTLESYFEKESK